VHCSSGLKCPGSVSIFGGNFTRTCSRYKINVPDSCQTHSNILASRVCS
jgi:hypothetical protein